MGRHNEALEAFNKILSPNLLEKFGLFRVFIIGRANSCETTILQQFCNSVDHPETYDGNVNEVHTSGVTFIIY